MATASLDELLSRRELYTGVTDDSRRVKKGYVFVAVPGTKQDGMAYVDQAVAAGASAIVGQAARPAHDALAVPYVQVSDAREAFALIATELHGRPSRELSVVGITGTCGKTTVSYLIESILLAAQRRPGVVGSIAYRYPGVSHAAPLTTPGAERLQSMLREMVTAGCDSLVMEVTSHSLQQMRVKGIGFDVAAFTNLSIDHLDFHSTMEEYFLAKTALFREYVDDSRAQGKDPVAVVNAGDEYGRKLLQLIGHAAAPMRTISFSLDGSAEINASRVTWSESGIAGSAGGVDFASPLAGRFNVENILTAIAVGTALGIAPAAIAGGIAALTRVPGRLDPVDDLSHGVLSHGVAVFVDHAHKPGALQVVLQTLGEVKKSGRLIVVFGCGGDRDKSKRPIMGRIAQDLADEVWVTSDNSRTEEPSSIIGDIMTGISSPSDSVHVEVDRRRAISEAIRGARRGDVVIIAGRGHETYQICYDPTSPTRTRTIDFDDRAEALLALQQFHAG